MILSRRERYIAIGVVAAVGLLVLDQFVLTPYTTLRRDIASERDQVMEQLNKADSTFSRKRKLEKIWAEMQQGGLKADASQAESQALHAVLDSAQSAGVNLAALKPERSVHEGQFQIISFHVTGTGPTSAIARLLWSLETAGIPVRVNDMQITPRKEGTDDLSMQMSVSTLCMSADANQAPKSTANVAEIGGEK